MIPNIIVPSSHQAIKPHILIVEDSEDIGPRLKSELEDLKFKVDLISTLDEFRLTVDQGLDNDVIIFDIGFGLYPAKILQEINPTSRFILRTGHIYKVDYQPEDILPFKGDLIVDGLCNIDDEFVLKEIDKGSVTPDEIELRGKSIVEAPPNWQTIKRERE